MNTKKFSWIFLLALGLAGTGCQKKFDEYALNKNLPQHVPPGVVLRGILNNLVVFPGDDADKQCQYYCSNYTYYGNNQYWTGSTTLNYPVLNNVLAMEAEAKRSANSDINPYHALGYFFRAFFFVDMTEKVGDLPMVQALQGLDNKTPAYDSQKAIFKQSLLWLDSANSLLNNLLANGFLEFSGDFYYKERLNSPLAGNNGRDALVVWQKVVNSYKLRVLIELSKKESDADLNIKQEFAKVVNNPAQYPIFTSNDDNLQYVYNASYNYYPDNITNYGFNQLRINPSATWLNTLSQLRDIRCMFVAEPARGLGYTDTSYQSYVGGPSGEDLSTMAADVQAGKVSLFNRNRYYSGYTGEPTFILSYPEVCFCIAEAINRGWISGSAETWYKKGVTAMFGYYGVKDGDNQVILQKKDGNLGDNVVYTVNFSFDAYFNQAAVKYKGDNINGLAQILTQKYLAYARNSGYQAYYQWRRTGVPAFDQGPGTGNGGVIPKRWQYPNNERSANTTNYNTAIQNQYAGKDDINALMWLLK